MFTVLRESLHWLPAALYTPIAALLSLMAIVVCVRLASAVLSIIATVLEILIPWK